MLKLHHEHHRDTKGFRINKDNDTANKYEPIMYSA